MWVLFFRGITFLIILVSTLTAKQQPIKNYLNSKVFIVHLVEIISPFGSGLLILLLILHFDEATELGLFYNQWCVNSGTK